MQEEVDEREGGMLGGGEGEEGGYAGGGGWGMKYWVREV